MSQRELRKRIRRGEVANQCKLPDCTRAVYAKLLCKVHYERQRRRKAKDTNRA
jgi:hypothetical protein